MSIKQAIACKEPCESAGTWRAIGYRLHLQTARNDLNEVHDNNIDRPPDSENGESGVEMDLDYLFMTAGNYR